MKTSIQSAFIIDDDDIYIFGIKKLIQIKKLAENLLIFGNGEEAFEELQRRINVKETLPEIILLDINMPSMNGWEFIDQFIGIEESLRKNTKIYMVSSSIDPEDIEKAQKLKEIEEYIIKPIDLNTLIKIFS